MKNFEIFWEWAATAVLMIGVTLTALNIYPANIYISLLGNMMWLVLGYMWRKYSLIMVQIMVTLIYLYGIHNYLN